MLKAAAKDLARSGVSIEEADFAEMYSVKDASQVYEDFEHHPALVIPYVDPWTDDYMQFKRDGECLPFCRVRYFTPPSKVKSFKKQKQQRYTQPRSSGVHPYFPMVQGLDWIKIAVNPDTPLVITEGEKKALAACLIGIPTIGLGGVYNFSQDGELLPILDKFDWEGRTVWICYDSDAVDNINIQAAEARLATELSMKRKANVFLVRIPQPKSGKKMGVDDFIVEYGDEAFYKLLEGAPEMRKMDKEVLRLNASAAWIEKEGLVLDLDTDTWIKKSDFSNGSRFSTTAVPIPSKKAGEVKMMSLAELWLKHPHARRYTDTIFRPDTDDKAIKLDNGGIAYNRFRGLEGIPGDVQPFFDLYDYIMSKTDEFDHDLVWKTICYKVQNFGETIGLGLVMIGPQGGGKSLFGEILSDMVKPYGSVIKSSMLGSDFNPWVETSLVVVMNEAKSKQLKHNMDEVKTYVTDKEQPMNEKYRTNRTVTFYGFLVFNSNERTAGAFPDDDRRMIVLDCPNTHPDRDDFYVPIHEWRRNGGPKKLLHFMQNYDLKGWKPPRHAPQTREKRMAYFNSLTPVQKLAHAVKDGDENLVAQWISASLDWAASDSAQLNPGLASDVASSLNHLQIRPFYTPEELALLFPHITSQLRMSRVKDATRENILAQELVQQGVRYLKCKDNFDGFRWKGQIRQYLIISNQDEFDKPITQEEFEVLMATYPKYKDYREQRHRDANKKIVRSQRKRDIDK